MGSCFLKLAKQAKTLTLLAAPGSLVWLLALSVKQHGCFVKITDEVIASVLVDKSLDVRK